MKLNRVDALLLTALFAVSLAGRALFVLPSGFDGLYGQDAFAYYDFAAALHQGAVTGPFFWPLGYPLLLAGGFALFGLSAWVAQALSLVLGALLPPLVYLLARQCESRQSGALLAGLLLACCGQAAQSSLVVMADVPALLWVTLSAVLLAAYLRDDRPRWLALSALLMACAVITRWLNLALAAVWILAVLLHWRGHPRWRAAFLALGMALLVLVPQLAYSAASPFPSLNHAWVHGWSPANALVRDFVNVDGQFHYEQVNAAFYARPFYDVYYLAPLFTPLILLGLVALVRQRNAARLTLLAGWALLPYAFLAGIPYQNIRFPLIVFPAVAILAGLGADALRGWFATRPRRQRYAVQSAAILLAAWGLAMTVSAGQGVIAGFIATQQGDRAVAAWAADQLPAGARLYTFGLTLTLQHETDLDVYELYYETPGTLAAAWQHGSDDYLLLNVWVIENQWAGREPQIAYHWLRDARGLVVLDRLGDYTLFRVEG